MLFSNDFSSLVIAYAFTLLLSPRVLTSAMASKGQRARRNVFDIFYNNSDSSDSELECDGDDLDVDYEPDKDKDSDSEDEIYAASTSKPRSRSKHGNVDSNDGTSSYSSSTAQSTASRSSVRDFPLIPLTGVPSIKFRFVWSRVSTFFILRQTISRTTECYFCLKHFFILVSGLYKGYLPKKATKHTVFSSYMFYFCSILWITKFFRN